MSDQYELVERLIDKLRAETLKRVDVRPRDKREPGRKEKEAAEAQMSLLLRRVWRKQQAKIAEWMERNYPERKATLVPPEVWEDWEEWDEEDIADFILMLQAARKKGIKLFREQVAIGIDYTAVNSRAAAAARRYTYELIDGINDTTLDVVRNAISMFVETPGLTIGDVVRSLPFDEERSLSIATTEITRAYADGQMEAGQELKEKYPDVAVVKQWFTNEDDRVCVICGPLADLDAVDLDYQYFEPDEYNDGQKPPAHVNCRCWMNTSTKITND